MKIMTYEERDIGGYQGLSVPTGSRRLSVDQTVYESDCRSEAIRQLRAMRVAARERGVYHVRDDDFRIEDPLFVDAFSVRDPLLPFLREMVNDIQMASFSGDYLECESLLQKVQDRILDLIEIDLPGYRDEMRPASVYGKDEAGDVPSARVKMDTYPESTDLSRAAQIRRFRLDNQR